MRISDWSSDVCSSDLFQKKSKYHDAKATQEQPRWFLVDVGFVRKLDAPIPLQTIRDNADALGEDFALTRKGSRLSVLPVTAAQWKLLLARSEEHTSELQSLMRISYAVFCLKKKKYMQQNSISSKSLLKLTLCVTHIHISITQYTK